MRRLFLLCIIITRYLTVDAQYTDWHNYLSPVFVKDYAFQGNLVWVASFGGGLVRIDTATNTALYFNKANSGLPDVFLTSVAVDGNGMIWIGTLYHGLVSFDGISQWTHYTTQNSNLPNNNIQFLFAAADGTIWAAAGSNIVHITGVTFHIVYIPPPNFSSVNCISQAPDGTIWAACVKNGILKIDSSGCFLYDELNTGLQAVENVFDLSFDTTGKLWGISNDNWFLLTGTFTGQGNAVFVTYDGNTWSIQGLSSPGCNQLPWITAIEHDSGGNLWFSKHYTELSAQSPCKPCGFSNTDTLINFGTPFLSFSPALQSIMIVKKDAQGGLWYGGFGGLARVSGSPGTWKDYSHLLAHHLSAPGIFDLAINRNNNNVAASTGLYSMDQGCTWWIFYLQSSFMELFGRGFSVFDGTGWTNYDSINPNLSENTARRLAFDMQGNLWFPCTRDAFNYFFIGPNPPYTGHIKKFDGSQIIDFTYPNWAGLSQYDRYTDAFCDDAGTVWIAALDRLLTYDGPNGWQIPYSFAAGDVVNAMAGIGMGELWIGSEDHLRHIKNNVMTTYNLSSFQLPDCPVRDLIKDNKDNIWVGTNYGLLKIKPDGSSVVYTAANSGLPDDKVNALAYDSTDYLWVGTLCDGLARYDLNIGWDYYTTDSTGLTDDRITCLEVDANNRLWIGTSDAGICVFDNGYTVGKTPSSGSPKPLKLLLSPNPVSDQTDIRFHLVSASDVSISVYNALGREAALLIRKTMTPGNHQLKWNACDEAGNKLSPGLYFIKITTANDTDCEKILLVR